MIFDDKELTLLSEEEVWGVNGGRQLDVLRQYGTKSAITDLVVLTGGYCGIYIVPDDDTLKGRTGWVYTRSSAGDGYVRGVSVVGSRYYNDSRTRNGAVRPALLSSSVFSQISPNRVRGYNGTEEVEYGEYPQYAPDSDMQRRLESEYQRGNLRTTGRDYTFDRTEFEDYDQYFQPVKYDEYEYNGRKYIRVQANSDYGYGNNFELSNGEYYQNGNYVWVEVSPVVWLIDDRTKTLVSKRGILSGIRFHTDRKNYNGDFSTTDMKEYLDKYMLRDLTQTATLTRVQDMTPEEQKQAGRRRNPYGLKFGQVSEEEIIRGAIEGGVAVFLHGPSSEGKSARVKQIDPTCEIIYLRNATPESLNGKSVYNGSTGEMIDVPPTWLKKLYEKLLQEKQQRQQQGGQGNSQQQSQSQQQGNLGSECSQQQEKQSQEQSDGESGEDSQKEDKSKQDVGHDTHSMWEQAVKKHKEQQEKTDKKESLLDKLLRKNKKDIDKKDKSKQDVGHDTHSMWEEAVKKHKKQQEKSDKKESLLDKLLGKNKKNIDKKDKEKDELEKKQGELESMGEKDAFKKNLEDKKKQLEELKKAISKQASQVGTSTNRNIRAVNDIGTAKPLIDWRYVLREAIKYDVDWSYKNATLEDGVVSANLEEQPMPETEIVLDTSGSINEVLLKNFLRECKNILQHTKLKLGCFDTRFYGFHEIRTEEDIEKMRFEGGGGTDFDVAVGAFSRRVENKIIFTDGAASMPDMPLDAIWIVFGGERINPKGGRVIHITPEQLDRLYSYEIESKTKGRSR